MSKNRIAVLLNPSAGRGRALRHKEDLEQRLKKLDISYDLFVTADEADLRDKTRILGRKYGVIVGAGGDSTFHIMANEILNRGLDVSLGLIGLGSSNDIVREFGLFSLSSACKALKYPQNRKIDLGGIFRDGHLIRAFFGQASLGLGVSVNRYVAEWTAAGSFQAGNQILAGILGVIKSYRSGDIPFDLNFRQGDAADSLHLNLVVFSNTRFWATGKIITPGASPTDGRLDACLIENCSILRLARLAWLAGRGKHTDAAEVALRQGERFHLSADRAFAIQADGEILGGALSPDLFHEIEIRVLPAALNILVRAEPKKTLEATQI